MIRFILALLFAVIALILSVPVWLIVRLIGHFRPETEELIALGFVRFAFSVIVWLSGAKVTTIGYENVPTDRPVLYIGNHRSYFDILISGRKLYRPTAYIAKKDFEHIPILCLWMKSLRCLFLDREDLRQGLKTVLTAIDYLKSNSRSVYVYPEGTRNKTDAPLLPFKEGTMKISTKSGAPIIPVAISGSKDVFEAQFPKLRPAKVVIRYGAPIYPDQLTGDDLKFIGKYTANIIEKMLEENEAILRQ
ncbi:MAG: 1-acyl-sn-glycerol-3-phosphate acyltransferase [Lachnospiraceae bacterium]|nr:1-acyl-sn-glycerol-3-phosphate acyltransferase [Lachnospiraceae bacterium]